MHDKQKMFFEYKLYYDLSDFTISISSKFDFGSTTVCITFIFHFTSSVVFIVIVKLK